MAGPAEAISKVPAITPRQRYLNRWGVLKQQRNGFDHHWMEIAKNFRPRRPRFNSNDRNAAATQRNDGIINNTPLLAGRTLAAGMMGGITSPSRPWFRLTLADRELAGFRSVKSWLHQTEEAMRLLLARSNIYSSLQVFYADLADFGTGVMWIDEDDEDVLRSYTIPVGQYALANSERLRVDTLYRFVPMTIGQMVERFGKEKCSATIQSAFNLNKVDEWSSAIHVVEPNRQYQPRMLGADGMPYKSCWMEEAGDMNTGFLRESGYYDCPFLACRWDATSEDVYGVGPGMDALGDAKGLQQMESDKLVMIEKLTNPPVTASTSMQTQPISLVPGKVTYVTDERSSQGIKPIHEVQPVSVQMAGLEIQRHEDRINRTYYVDLFMMLAQSDRRQITAREISERHEEKMQMLGPVLERLQDELLDPLIDRVFYIANRSGLIPPPPEELQGVPLRVEYISTLAQAQQAIGLAQVERYVGFTGSLVATQPEVLDNVDTDKVVLEYGQRLGITPDLMRSPEEVGQIRQARADQQRQAQQAEQAMATAQGAKTLADSNLSPDNALGRILANMGAGAVNEVGPI